MWLLNGKYIIVIDEREVILKVRRRFSNLVHGVLGNHEFTEDAVEYCAL